MKIYTLSILLLVGIILTPSIATYTTDENTDSSKTLHGAGNTISAGSEKSHRQNSYSNSGLNNIEQDSDGTRSNTIDNPAYNSAGQVDVRAGNRGQYYPGYPQPYPQLYPHPYPLTPVYYPPGQLDPGFVRFPSPQQGGPMPNFFPPSQGFYPQPQIWPYGPTAANFGTPQLLPHTHQHQRDQLENRHQRTNSQYTQEGNLENEFQGNINSLGYGSDSADVNKAVYNRPGY